MKNTKKIMLLVVLLAFAFSFTSTTKASAYKIVIPDSIIVDDDTDSVDDDDASSVDDDASANASSTPKKKVATITLHKYAENAVKAYASGKKSYTFKGKLKGCNGNNFMNKLEKEFQYVGVKGKYGLTGSYVVGNCSNFEFSVSYLYTQDATFDYDKFDYDYVDVYRVSWNNSVVKNEKKLNKKLKKISSKLKLNGKSKYAKIKTIHDYVVNTLSYDQSYASISHSAYGAVKNKKAVCQGYALLTMRLMNMNGIKCQYVAGGGHAWNIVEYKGKYYNLDATWDDPISYRGNVLKHDFFMKSDADILKLDKSGSHKRRDVYKSKKFKKKYKMATKSL